MTAYNHAEFNLTHQRAEITDEERRLIDEAIAKGKVQTIPQGKSAFEDEEYVWQGDPNDKRSIGKLVLKNPMTRDEAIAKHKQRMFKPHRKAPAKKNPEVAARRQRVREMSLQGMPRKAIAEALNITPRKVKADCTYLQEKGLLPVFSSGTPGMTVEQVEERRAKVKALVAENVTQREIAARLGFGFGAIQNDIRVMRERGELQ